MTIKLFPTRREVMTAAAALAAAAPASRLMAQNQPTPFRDAKARSETVKGVVFESRSGGVARQEGDPGLAGVLVSNGREVVRTGPDGAYSLPVEDGAAIFVIKPSGYAVPADAATRLPRFSY